MRTGIRARVSVVLFGALLAAGCGNSDDANGSGAAATTTDDAATTTAAATTVGLDAATRVVDTPMGQVEIPADPQRIAVLWGPTLAAVVEVGFAPVAAFGSAGDRDPAILQQYLPDDYPIADLEIVAQPREVNFEALAAVEPDLIMGGAVSHLEEGYSRLSDIAPTVLLTWDGTASWRTMLTDVADVLGVPERAEEAVDEYEAHVAQVREAVGLDASPVTVSVVRIQSAEEIRIETPASFSGQILADVGFDRPDGHLVADPDSDFISLSLEHITQVDAPEIIVLYYVDGDTQPAWESIQALDLWQALPAVQSGDVTEADFTDWGSSNYVGAHRVLDEIEAAFGS